ncbi:hypothetical protein AB0D49_09505 [Streptomyces sp. NPDC048290]|uniref:hypothetical protein n=1 Tax=Streptomyces sp. NPDC048290 TaxID=3155811 RepID=UPI003440084E
MPVALPPTQRPVIDRPVTGPPSEESVQQSHYGTSDAVPVQQSGYGTPDAVPVPPHPYAMPLPPPLPEDAPIYQALLLAWAHQGRTLPGRHDPEWVRLAAPVVRPGQFSADRDPLGGGR